MRWSVKMSGSNHRFTLSPASHLLVSASLIIIIVSTPVQSWSHLLVYVFLAFCLFTLSKVSFLKLALRLLLLTPFLAAVALSSLFLNVHGETVEMWHYGLPSFATDHLQFAAWLYAKAAVSTIILLLFGMSFSLERISTAMRQLYFPLFFVELVEMTIRYMEVFARDFTRLRMAAQARGLKPRHLFNIAPLGNLAGAQFLRSIEQGERIHMAMQARGYSSPVQVESQIKVRIQPLILPVCFIVVALGVRLCPI